MEKDQVQQEQNIIVLVIEPERSPYVKEISPSLESLQKEVGGYIEAVYPFIEEAAIICNEEGKLLGMPLNRALRDQDGQIYDITAGTFLIAGLTEDNFGSLAPELIEKYSEQFKYPEMFIRANGEIIALPLPAIEEKVPPARKPSLDTQIRSAETRSSEPTSSMDGKMKGRDPLEP